ncbi:hypothetical protein JCM14469_34510 [Desulfatiferula olefinivorans]
MLTLAMAGCTDRASINGPPGFSVDLSGTWQVRLGDNPAWAGRTLDDPAEWDRLDLPGSLARYALDQSGSAIGTLWLRKTVIVPPEAGDRDTGLILGRISHADEVYVNGVLVGKGGAMPPRDMSMWNISRHYKVPAHLIRPGEDNVIAVKVWFHTYGDVAGRLALSDEPAFERSRVRDLFVRVILNYVFIAMGIPLFLLFLLFYIQRPSSTEYLYYSLQLLCGFFIVLDLCSLWRFPGGIEGRFKIVAFSWVAINVVHPIFLHRFYGLVRKKIEWGLVAYLLLVLPLLFFVDKTQFRAWGLIVVFVSSSIGFYNLSCHVSALVLDRPYSRLFFLFGFIVVLGAIHDGLIYGSKLAYFPLAFWGYTFDNMLFPYGSAALYTGTAAVLVYRFIDLLKQNEDLNENLESKVAERTRALILLTEELEHKNITLGEMAIRDSLTGLYNHAAFYERLDEIFMTSRDNRAPMAVAMIDVDDFKGINDTYGHQVGDRVLLAMADILKTGIREYDFSGKFQGHRMADNRNYDLVGRCGGDEFSMVLPQCDRTSATAVTRRVCDRIDKIRIDNHPDLRVSASFGVAVLDPDARCPDSETLVALADLALYKSKAMGKNRICCKVYEQR